MKLHLYINHSLVQVFHENQSKWSYTKMIVKRLVQTYTCGMKSVQSNEKKDDSEDISKTL